MSWFMVYSGDLLIGWTDLHAIYRSRTTATGTLVPTAGYDLIQASLRELREEDQEAFDLQVVDRNGNVVDALSVQVADYTDQGEAIDVAVFGISHPPFNALFPCN